MKLIHFQGLNCYHDCMITLANAFGLDYTAAFSKLWAEGHLRYDPICDVFLSRKIQETLESMGMELDAPLTEEAVREMKWADTPAGDYAIIGMDACFIPWSPLHQLLHGPHYFIVQKGRAEQHECFDPTYGLSCQRLATQDLIPNAFALITVKTCHTCALTIDSTLDPLYAQSQEVLNFHPGTLRHFLEQAAVWMKGEEKRTLLPAKYVDTMLAGRHLYRHFLSGQYKAAKRAPLFFSHPFYEEWMAVKNGFYKAALTRQSRAVFDESCRLFAGLFEQELELAEQISAAGSNY